MSPSGASTSSQRGARRRNSFTESERAALAVTEEATLIADRGVSEPVWDEAVRALGEEGVAQVLMAVVAINSWNRIAVATGQALLAMD